MFGKYKIIVTGHLTRTVFLLTIILGCVYSQDTNTQGLKLTLLEVGTSPVSVGVQQRRSINLVEGRSYNISCNREGGFGTATSVWLKSNSPITSNTGAQVYAIMMDTQNWILVLQTFRASDVGNYTCKGTNSNVTLDIGTSNPTVIASTPQLSVSSRVLQGSRATLQAFVSGTPPPTDSDITWYFNNNQSIPDGSLIDGTDLLLPRIPLPSHSGKYTIQVITTMGTARDSFVVTVTTQPSPSISPVDNQVRVNGTSISLTCQDSQGVPAPTFSWTRDGSSLVNDDRTTITSMTDGSVTLSTLTINPLLPGDTGMYGCVADNSDGSSSAFVRVDVHFKPILEPFSTQLRWVIGSTATLQTLLYAAIPNNSITFYWTNPSNVIIDSSQYTTTAVNNSTVYGLVLPNLEREDKGRYMCVVQNNIGTSTQIFDLFITVPPVLEHIDGSLMRRNMLARNGASQVMLVANVKEAIPNIAASQVSWRKGNDPVEQSVKYITTERSSQVNLTITSLAMSDSGLYTVTIVHEAGSASLEFQLVVLDPPAPPTLLWVTPVTACTAEIIWDINRTQPTTTAIPSYIVIEASLSRDSSAEWVQVGTADISKTSLVGPIPSGGLNTSYWLRARSGNRSVGEGENYLDPDTFYAYTEDMFPTLSSVNGEPSSDSQTIRVQWSLLPQQDCFSPSFNVHCAPLEASATSGQNRVTQDLRSALVRNLTSNTFYNCSVTVNFDGFGVSSKTYANNAIVTFPPRTIRNDTVIGDPLYAAPVYSEDGKEYSLCYEVRGRANTTLNLVSDTCVSVNARYSPMDDPELGNIISSVGVRAKGDGDNSCHNIRVDLEGCSATIDSPSGASRSLSNLENFEQDGISVRKYPRRVRIAAPNCENVMLVMWVICENRNNQDMIKFVIARGVNLRASSHGLLGQFWNVPLTFTKFNGTLRFGADPSRYYVVTIKPGDDSPTRSFLGQFYHLKWDKSRESCLYVGNSQAGPTYVSEDPNAPNDSIIEGRYRDYIMINNDLFGTDFAYNEFEEDRC